uniref:Uncharacterized protein LOC104227700 isoform X2 n=1 Tax=Nicotiana sylvestris TaxID=4096 RepID=A0A1U7WUC8_NICSY|nr:PREDICTED: uncharacterized protein LOC104227700 isoform X2 [Nicotiana sylvestris]
MEVDRFLPPFNYYNDPRARHPWLNAVLNIPATTPDPRPEVLPQNFSYAQGVVQEGAASMGSVVDTRMIGTHWRFEHPNPSVSFQYQQCHNSFLRARPEG